MPQLSVELPLHLSVEQCRAFLQRTETDALRLQAYRKLRGTDQRPVQVLEDTEDRFVLFEPMYDPSLKSHSRGRTGWTLTYTFQAQEPGEMILGLEVSYDWRTALLGLGLMRAQAQSELIHRINTLVAYERGLADGQAQASSARS